MAEDTSSLLPDNWSAKQEKVDGGTAVAEEDDSVDVGDVVDNHMGCDSSPA